MTKLFRMAKIAGGRPHRFRHTFALAVVVAGTPIDQISVLLWRSSIKVTEKRYAPWVKARQDQMDASVIRSWENPLIVQQWQWPTKGTPEMHGKQLIQ